MELKQSRSGTISSANGVLIVPYGIETRKGFTGSDEYRVLIVPYGIETTSMLMRLKSMKVLIVPYGIETNVILRLMWVMLSVNCTLWN